MGIHCRAARVPGFSAAGTAPRTTLTTWSVIQSECHSLTETREAPQRWHPLVPLLLQTGIRRNRFRLYKSKHPRDSLAGRNQLAGARISGSPDAKHSGKSNRRFHFRSQHCLAHWSSERPVRGNTQSGRRARRNPFGRRAMSARKLRLFAERFPTSPLLTETQHVAKADAGAPAVRAKHWSPQRSLQTFYQPATPSPLTLAPATRVDRGNRQP